ncbi:SGNH/GDSL hydrolase family protein [Marinobacterium rhizophilum]|uniref:SGNH/GDSL hydrolase family protein n=1 Tax=Marinobacterium rhizophilum TaxID=420402 RepID=UPI000374DA5F|nr:SGNH/GDSL hydrolase family protein [Marinobacterium rhizophilum]
MHQILVYADSLSWGIIPDSRQRFAFEQRWPGVMELALGRAGVSARVIENCLNGRRTVWDDPFKPGRNGLEGLGACIEMNSPLALVILLLGTNDFQSMHAHNAWHSAQGLSAVIGAIRGAPIEPGMPVPPILVVAPPPVQKAKGLIAPKFAGAETRALGLRDAIESVARERGCHFFDAGAVTPTSRVDGVHLDEDQHRRLGEALALEVQTLLPHDQHPIP